MDHWYGVGKVRAELLSITELSQATKIPVNTLYQLVNRGVLPHYKLGRALRFDLNEVLTHFRREPSNTPSSEVKMASEPSSLTIESAMRRRRDLPKRRS